MVKDMGVGSLEKQLFLFSATMTLRAQEVSGESWPWAMDTHLSYWDSVGWASPRHLYPNHNCLCSTAPGSQQPRVAAVGRSGGCVPPGEEAGTRAVGQCGAGATAHCRGLSLTRCPQGRPEGCRQTHIDLWKSP